MPFNTLGKVKKIQRVGLLVQILLSDGFFVCFRIKRNKNVSKLIMICLRLLYRCQFLVSLSRTWCQVSKKHESTLLLANNDGCEGMAYYSTTEFGTQCNECHILIARLTAAFTHVLAIRTMSGNNTMQCSGSDVRNNMNATYKKHPKITLSLK
jgi:hypothetical protein